MVWIDGKGADTWNNQIVSLTGSWSNGSSTFKEGTINWGSSVTAQAGFNDVAQSFSQNINYTNRTLGARSRGYFTKVVNGVTENGKVTIEVAPSIFD